MLVTLRPRQEMKKVWMMMKFMIQYGTHLTPEQREELRATASTIQKNLNSMEPAIIDPDDIVKRRRNLASNTELIEIFNMFWNILAIEANAEGALSKQAYINFNVMLQLALMGDAAYDEQESFQCGEADYVHDVFAYGEINEVTFRDVMMEMIEVWSDMVNERYYTAFAWALLGSMVDVHAFPPKFRPKKQIKCITSIENEGDILSKFHNEKKLRSNIQLKSEWLTAANLRPEVQQRLAARRVGTLHRAISDVFDILAIKESERRRSPDGRFRRRDTEEDSGDEDTKYGDISPTASCDSAFGDVGKHRFSFARAGSNTLSKARSNSFADEDDDITTDSKGSQNSRRRSSSIKETEERSLSRSNSMQAHIPPDGALPKVTGRSGPNVGTAAAIARSNSGDLGGSSPVSREKTPTGHSPSIYSRTMSGRISPQASAVTGKGSHRQYRPTPVILPTANKEEISVNFAEELAKWLSDVTHFTGDIFAKSKAREQSHKVAAGKSNTQTEKGALHSSTSRSSGTEINIKISTPSKPLNTYHELSDDDHDDQVSVSSQITTGSVGIVTMEVKSKPYTGRLGAHSVSLNELEPKGPSTLELLMAGTSTHSPFDMDMESRKLGNFWNPKRTQVKLRKLYELTPKLKVAKTVSEKRKRYRVQGYLPEIKRGKNPLKSTPGLRAQESCVSDIVEALAEHASLVNAGATDDDQLSKYILDSNGSVRRRNSLVNLKDTKHQKSTSPSPSRKRMETCNGQFFLTGFSESGDSAGDTYRVPSTLFMSQSSEESSNVIKPKIKAGQDVSGRLTVTANSIPVYYVSTLHSKPRLASDSLTVSSSTHRQSQSLAFGVSAPGPWIPPGGLNVMVSDKTDVVFGHEENRDVGMIVETTKNKTVLGRQKVVREAFEKYCNMEAKKQGLDLLASMKKHNRARGVGSRGPSPASGCNTRLGSPSNL